MSEAAMRVSLLLLLAGFACNAASAFTTFFAQRWGERAGRLLTAVLRNLLGIPVWVIGLVLAVRVPSPPLLSSTVVTGVLGWLLLLAGGVLQVWALAAIRMRAAAPGTGDALVESGPYARLRHPIYAGLLLEFVGIVLLTPTVPSALACGLGALWAVLQARFEEVDLVRRLPAYRDYMARVPRFVPRAHWAA
jgi:protein-S-isoprenylcysteine O-methyltransferase Ste14